MDRLGIGIIGCGNISTTYLGLAPLFRGLEVRAVADMNMAAAQARAWGLFMRKSAWGATVVVGRVPWLASGSGASKTTMLFTSWLRFTVK